MAEKKKLLLRLPQKLHDEIRAWAAQEMRSINGQIEYLLREAVVKQRKRKPEELADPPEEE